MLYVIAALLFCILLAVAPGLADALGRAMVWLFGAIACLVGVALVAIAYSYLAHNRDALLTLASIVGGFAILVAIVAGLAKLSEKLCARYGERRGQWFTLAGFVLLTPALVGLALAAAFVADHL